MFQFTPYVLLSFIALLVSIWLGITLWSRRPGLGIIPFVVMAIGLTIWTSGSLGRLISTTLVLKVIFGHLTYLGITIVPAAWLSFILEYTGNQKWVTRRLVTFLAIEPILVQLVMLTNPIHSGFWIDPQMVTIDGLTILQSTNGIGFWIHAVYSYILLLISCVVLLHTLIKSPHLYRGQIFYLLIGVFAPWVANIVFITGLSPLPSYIDLTPLAFTVTVASVAWSMYRFRLLDLVPIARDVIVDSMEDAILVLDMSNRVLDVNPSAVKLLNKPFDQIVGQSIIDVVPHRAELIRSFDDMDDGKREFEIDIMGTTSYFELRMSSIYNRKQVVTGRVVTLHDITVLKEGNLALQRANEQAQEMTRLKSQFLATMSHELRTPLNAIIGYTELQLAGIIGELSETQQQYQERVFANAQHLLGLINDVLDLSKIEAGRMELIAEPFNLRQWADEIIQQNSVLAQEKKLKFVHQIDKRFPEELIGDAGRLKQIVINLLSNAIKFTSEGQVSLTIDYCSQEKWAITVADTGIGIPSHKLETIFDEFHQVDNSSTREYSGTGLGLAIVRKLASSMGGNVRVESTTGEGTQFSVTLPLTVNESEKFEKSEIIA